MTKIIAMFLLIVVGVIAARFLNEDQQKKGAIVFGILVAIAALGVFISELVR